MFAVATRFHLKCYPLPRAIAASNYFFSLHDLKESVDQVVAAGRKMPDTVELSIFLIKAPAELAAACADHEGKLCMISAVAFGMTSGESRAALAPLEGVRGHEAGASKEFQSAVELRTSGARFRGNVAGESSQPLREPVLERQAIRHFDGLAR